MEENTLSVLKIAPGQYPQQVEIDNDLKALQQAVGGSIGASYPFAFASLTPELAQKYEQLFHQPEAFLKLGNRLLVLPVPDEPPAEKPRTKPPAEHDR